MLGKNSDLPGVMFLLLFLPLKGNIQLNAGGLTHVIVATWEAEIRRITVQGQPGYVLHENSSPK
jgi:hypothetical protein